VLSLGGQEVTMRASKPITITLGDQQRSVDARLQSGRYPSIA
jgi:hypothetical protein